MAIAAKLSSFEVTEQVSDRFVDKYLEARLINAPGVTYTPGTTNDATFLANEVTIGTGGYARQIVTFAAGDLTAYTDGGVGLATKSTVFAHDGGGTTLGFSHVALCWSSGNVTGLDVTGITVPTSGIDGTYTDLPIDSTSGSGVGLTVDLTVQNSGAASTDFILSIRDSGYGYTAGDTLTILESTLVAAGAVVASAGSLSFNVGTIYDNAADNGEIMSVAQTTSSVQLTAGREAVFYWNLKQYDVGVA